MKFLPLVLTLAALAPAAQASVSPKVLRAEAKAFARVDKDGDEAVSYEEFEALLKPLQAALKKFPVTGRGDDPEKLLELCEGVFDYFDANADDVVDFDEWLSVRQDFDLESLASLLASLPGLDRNGDGRVTIMEFQPLVKCFIPLSHAKTVYREIVTDFVAAHGGSTGGTLSMGSSGSMATTSGGRGSGGPTTGGTLVIGGGTTTGVVSFADSLNLVAGSVSVSWSSLDLAAAAAWVSTISANDNPATLSGLVNPWAGSEPISEEGRGQR